MVSEKRMRLDLVGQLALSVALMLGLVFEWIVLARLSMVILWLWQLVSALELRYGYRRPLRQRFVRFAIWQVLLVAVLLWFWPQGVLWPLLLSATYYLVCTVRDWRIVARRPVSFWDLV